MATITENKNYGNNEKKLALSANKAKTFFDEAIIQDDPKWGEKLREYKNSKNIFYYDKSAFPPHITEKMIINSQAEFNPITQKYYDEKKEQNFRKNTKIDLITMISKGYDKQLSVENTYDIINLRNKLKYFNYDESSKKCEKSPKKNENGFNYEKNNVKPYNIISNLSLRVHNSVKPELRPKNDDAMINSNEGLHFKKSNKPNELD